MIIECLGSNKDVVSYHASLCGLAQESSKGDDGWHAGAVEEEEGGQTLQTEGVCVVGKVVRSLSLDVQDEPAKYPEVKQGFYEMEPQMASEVEYNQKSNVLCVGFVQVPSAIETGRFLVYLKRKGFVCYAIKLRLKSTSCFIAHYMIM